eukprot:gene4830-34577_t
MNMLKSQHSTPIACYMLLAGVLSQYAYTLPGDFAAYPTIYPACNDKILFVMRPRTRGFEEFDDSANNQRHGVYLVDRLANGSYPSTNGGTPCPPAVYTEERPCTIEEPECEGFTNLAPMMLVNRTLGNYEYTTEELWRYIPYPYEPSTVADNTTDATGGHEDPPGGPEGPPRRTRRTPPAATRIPPAASRTPPADHKVPPGGHEDHTPQPATYTLVFACPWVQNTLDPPASHCQGGMYIRVVVKLEKSWYCWPDKRT